MFPATMRSSPGNFHSLKKIKIMKYTFIIAAFTLLLISSCSQKPEFRADFNNINDRIWIGRDFWSIPIEDWKVENGRMESIGKVPESRVMMLTHDLTSGTGRFRMTVKSGLVSKGDQPGSAGFLIGMHDPIDSTVKAACYYGEGIRAGVSLKGYAFLKGEQASLPENFNWNAFTMTVEGDGTSLSLKVRDDKGHEPEILHCKADSLHGLVGVAANLKIPGTNPGTSTFWFDDWSLSGPRMEAKPQKAFGPVLWTMYTLSKNTVKLMAFLPPLGENDNQDVDLQLQKDGKWETVTTETLEPDTRTAVFRLENWDSSKDAPFRVKYMERGKDGSEQEYNYDGTIRRDPVDRPLRVAAMTGQNHVGYPYSPVVENLKKLNPDLLYFSGDQIYESNGGYGIIRRPADRSILNYLGKYYMFGWAFGDLMRDRPTICTPDDHEVYQGNLWGEGGKPTDQPGRNRRSGRFYPACENGQCREPHPGGQPARSV